MKRISITAPVLSLMAAFVVGWVSPCLADECVTLVANAQPSAAGYSSYITLDAGDSATLASFTNLSMSAIIEVVVGGYTLAESPWLNTNATVALKSFKVAGPATLRVGTAQNNDSLHAVLIWGTFNITRAATLQNAVPANAVVIPENASGQFQVILESSTDLVTWTAANPGSYGGTTQKRFFRTRIVQTN
jgi:hypothetical protein